MTGGRTLRRTGVQVWLVQAVLSLGALVGVASLVLAVSTVACGVQPLIFRSGSMSPGIQTGALALSHKVAAVEVKVGDVVSVLNSQGERVTHRVTAVDRLTTPEGGVSLQLKGDANSAPDQEQYVVTSVDRVFFNLPRAGRVAAWMSGPVGMFIAGLAVAGLVAFGVRRRHRPGGPGSPGGGHKTAAATVAVAAALAGAGGATTASAAQGTLASWNDTGSVGAGAFATHRVAQPGVLTCEAGLLGLLSMKVSTTSTDDRYEYLARVFNAATGGTQIGSDKSMGTGAAGSVRSYTFGAFDFSGGLLNLGSTYYVRVYARLPGTDWISQDFRTQAFSYTSVIIVGVLYSCVP